MCIYFIYNIYIIVDKQIHNQQMFIISKLYIFLYVCGINIDF